MFCCLHVHFDAKNIFSNLPSLNLAPQSERLHVTCKSSIIHLSIIEDLKHLQKSLNRNKLLWIAERECNKDAMKNKAIFIEFRMCNFHWGKYWLKMIVGSDSE